MEEKKNLKKKAGLAFAVSIQLWLCIFACLHTFLIYQHAII